MSEHEAYLRQGYKLKVNATDTPFGICDAIWK